MIYFKKVGAKYAELIKNVNSINNQVYYDDYKYSNRKNIDKQVRHNLFILKNNSWHITNSVILLVI